jgi:hypothetical protein
MIERVVRYRYICVTTYKNQLEKRIKMEKEKFMDLSEEAELMTNGGATCVKTNTTKTQNTTTTDRLKQIGTPAVISFVASGGQTCSW